MKSFKQTTLRTATIAAMFVTLGAAAVSAQDPGGPPPVSGSADGGSWQGGPGGRFGGRGDFGGPGPRFGGREDFGGPGGRFGGPGGPGGRPSVAQIPAKALSVLLGLTSDQTDKIAAIQKDARPMRPAAFRPGGRDQAGFPGGPGGRDQAGPPDGQEGRGFPGPQQGRRGPGSEAAKKAKADIMAVLTSSQKARVPEITDEVCALRAARVPLEALPTLGLSADQQKKIAAIGTEGTKKIAALTTGDGDDDPGASLQDIHEAMGDDVSALLTSDQRAKVRAARREFRPEGGRGGMMPPPRGGMGWNAGQDGMPPPPRNGGDFAQGPGGRRGDFAQRGRMGGGGPGGQPGPDMQDGPGMGGDAPAGPPPPDGGF